MCYQVLFCITLFISRWLIIALPERDWSTQSRSYDKEYHILLKYEGKCFIYTYNIKNNESLIKAYKAEYKNKSTVCGIHVNIRDSLFGQ